MTTAQERFIKVRCTLDDLGYKQPLGMDSLPLVEKIIADLVNTRGALSQTKLELESRTEILGRVEECIRPYKSDNARLVKEINLTHKEMDDLRLKYDETVRDMTSKIRNLESLNSDLNFFNSQCLDKLKAYELETKRMAEQIVVLQEKNFQAVVFMPNGNKKQVPFRRQRMEIESLLPENPSCPHDENNNGCQDAPSSSYCCSVARYWAETGKTQPPETIDILESTSKRCKELEEGIKLLETDKDLNSKKFDALEKQLQLRDSEINRLRQLVEGGRPLAALLLDDKRQQTDSLAENLQLQVELLQARTEELERRLLKQSSSTNCNHNGSEITITVQDKASECNILPYSNEVQFGRREMADMLDRLERTRQHLLGRIDELVTNEKQLLLNSGLDIRRTGISPQSGEEAVDENRRAASKIPRRSTTAPNRWETSMRMFIEGLIADRDTLQSEVDFLIQTIRSWLLTGDECISEASPRSPEVVHLTADNQNVYKHSLDPLEVSHPRKPQSSKDGRPTAEGKLEDDLDVAAVKAERDQLRGMLNLLEKQVVEIQDNVRHLRTERDDLVDEVNTLRNKPTASGSGCPPAVCPPDTNARYQERPRIRRSGAAAGESVSTDQLSRCMVNLDSAPAARYERGDSSTLRLISRTGSAEQVSQPPETANTPVAPEVVQKRLQELALELEASRTRVAELTRQVASLQEKLELSKKEAAEKEAEKAGSDEQLLTALSQTRARNVSLSHELAFLKDQNSQLTNAKDVLESRLSAAQNDLQLLHKRLADSSADLKTVKAESARLRDITVQLDKEKDSLQAALDGRVEEVVSLKQDIANKTQLLEERSEYLKSLEMRLRDTTETAAVRERDTRALEDRLQELEASAELLRRTRDIAEEKCCKIKQDVVTLTHEVSTLKLALQKAQSEAALSDEHLAMAKSQVKELQKALDSRDQECRDILQRYRTLSHSLEVANTRTGETEQQLHERERRLHTKECELEAALTEVRETEKALHAQRAALELQQERIVEEATSARLQCLTAQVTELSRDLVAARELCSQLEKKREASERETAKFAGEAETAHCQISALRQEIDSLRFQLSKQKDEVLGTRKQPTRGRDGDLNAQRLLQSTDSGQRTRDGIPQRFALPVPEDKSGVTPAAIPRQLVDGHQRQHLPGSRVTADRLRTSVSPTASPAPLFNSSSAAAHPVVATSAEIFPGQPQPAPHSPRQDLAVDLDGADAVTVYSLSSSGFQTARSQDSLSTLLPTLESVTL
uniref:Centrosomal protein of 135 kDa n=1 Tax=Schistocephalus solidus TaxID=70667 RepID=A0A0X3Q5L9_SCHSO